MPTIEYSLTGDANDLPGELKKVEAGFGKVAKKADKADKANDKVGKSSGKLKVGLEGLKKAADGVGGKFGESAGRLQNFTEAAGLLGSATGVGGPVVLGLAAMAAALLAVGVAVVSTTAAMFGLVVASDDLLEKLKPFEDLEGFQPIDPEAVGAVHDVTDSLAALRTIFDRMVLLLGANFAPVLEEVSVLMVKFGLISLDLFTRFVEGKSVIREFANFLAKELVQALLFPADAIFEVASALGDLMTALGFTDNAFSRIVVGWEKFSALAGGKLVDGIIGLADDGISHLSDVTTDYDARARALLNTQRELKEAVTETTKAVKDQADGTEKLKSANEKATADLIKEYEKRKAAYDKMIADMIAEEERLREQATKATLGGINDILAATQRLAEMSIGNSEDMTEAQKKNALTAFRISQAAALIQIAINTAVAITAALAQLGPVAGGIAAAGIAVTGGVQAAAVGGQSPPEFPGGGVIEGDLLQTSGMSSDHGLVGAQKGESVLNKAATSRLGRDGVDALNRGGGGGGWPTIGQMVYKHRIFDSFVRDNLAKGGPLADAIQGRRRVGHRRTA